MDAYSYEKNTAIWTSLLGTQVAHLMRIHSSTE